MRGRYLGHWNLGHGKLRSWNLRDGKLSGGNQFGLDWGHGKWRRLDLRGCYLGYLRNLRRWNL